MSEQVITFPITFPIGEIVASNISAEDYLLKIHIPTLWQTPLPNYYQIGDSVKAMLE
jgi:hypothetical protein